MDLGSYGPWELWTLGVMDLGSTEPWEYWTLGVLDLGSIGPGELWALTVLEVGNTGPWEYWTLGELDLGSYGHWNYIFQKASICTPKCNSQGPLSPCQLGPLLPKSITHMAFYFLGP